MDALVSTPSLSSPTLQPLDDLEAEIATLAANISAATCRWLGLLAAFDRREGWAGWGIKTCAHWLNWRCGIDVRTARDYVRVAHALETLPGIAAEFARGALSYSKVRAMTRIANAENEAYLLMIARHGTAAHVEALVRGYRRSAHLAQVEHANEAHDARAVRWHWDEDGMLVLHARLPAEQGAVVLKALEILDAPPPPCVGAGATAGSVLPVGAAAMPTGTLPVGAGVSPRIAPEVGGDWPVGPIPALAATNDAPVEIPTRGSAEPPGVQDDDRSPSQRRADALVVLAETGLATAACGGSTADRFLVTVHIDADVLRGATDGRCELDGGPALAAETARRLCCDGPVVTMHGTNDGDVLDVGRRTRAIPPALRRALQRRDGGCRFPGCTVTHRVDGHHIRHWAGGGETTLGNLVLLCRRHHRLVHEGGWRIERLDDGALRFRRPDGHPMPAAPPAPDARADIAMENALLGHVIHAGTGESLWQGEAMDVGWAVGRLWELGESICARSIAHSRPAGVGPALPISAQYSSQMVYMAPACYCAPDNMARYFVARQKRSLPCRR